MNECVASVALAVREFARSVRHALTLALQAFAEEDLGQALQVWHGDADVDRRHSSLFREIPAARQANEENVVPGAHLLFVLKNLERTGDDATSIAEACHFTATGHDPPGERPGAGSSSAWVPG